MCVGWVVGCCKTETLCSCKTLCFCKNKTSCFCMKKGRKEGGLGCRMGVGPVPFGPVGPLGPGPFLFGIIGPVGPGPGPLDLNRKAAGPGPIGLTLAWKSFGT